MEGSSAGTDGCPLWKFTSRGPRKQRPHHSQSSRGHSRGGLIRKQHFPIMLSPDGPQPCPCCHLNPAGCTPSPASDSSSQRMHGESSGRGGIRNFEILMCLCPACTVPPHPKAGQGGSGGGRGGQELPTALSITKHSSAECRKGLELASEGQEKLWLEDGNGHRTQKCRDHQGSAPAAL